MLSARLCRSLGRGKEGGGGVEEAMMKHMKSKNTRKRTRSIEAHKEAMKRHIIWSELQVLRDVKRVEKAGN